MPGVKVVAAAAASALGAIAAGVNPSLAPAERAGLVELADDDRATLYGAMLELAAKAREDHDKLMLWKRRGKRAFDAEAEGNETP